MEATSSVGNRGLSEAPGGVFIDWMLSETCTVIGLELQPQTGDDERLADRD
jgi:hypothetical protein